MDRSGTTDGVVAYSGARLFDGERGKRNDGPASCVWVRSWTDRLRCTKLWVGLVPTLQQR
jgi:hypothetical protein